MRVVCIFPVTNNIQNVPSILKAFQERIIPKLKSLGATTQEIKFAGTDYVYVETNKQLEGRPKGRGILESLKNVSEQPDCVICCDGSGAIPYEYIPYVFQELVSDRSISCVMSNRVGNKAIGDLRYLIERFEVFAIKRFHNRDEDIPDGQCGLWGYRYGAIYLNGHSKKIELTAEGYEIELDLLGEVLKLGLNYSFVDIELPPREAKSSFVYFNNLEKIKFFIKKYLKFDELLPQYLLGFENSSEYNGLLDQSNLISEWGKYKTDLLLIAKSRVMWG